MTSTKLTLNEVCDMFNMQTEDVKFKIYWLSEWIKPQNKNNQVVFVEELQRIGLKRVTPKKPILRRPNITTEELLRKQAENAAF